MIKLFLFEMKKIIKSTYVLITLLLFILLIVGYYIFVYYNTLRASEIASEIEYNIQPMEENLLKYYDLLSEDEENKQLQQKILFWEEYISREKLILNAHLEEDWYTVLNEEIKLEESNGPPSLNNIQSTYTFPTTFTKVTRYEYMKWLREKGIPPVLPIKFFTSWITIYDKDLGGLPSVEQFIKDRSTKYSSTGVYFLHHVFKLLFGMIGPIFFLLFFGDILTKEGWGRNGPIHLLRTQPIYSYQILVSKFWACLATTIFVLIGISLFALLTGTIADRFGDLDYPVLIYGENLSFSFMEMGTFIVQSTILSILVLVFCYSILFLFSVITKRVLLAVGLATAVIVAGVQWSGDSTLMTLAHYNPFHYFPVSKVITNELAVTMENSNFSFTNGLLVLGVYSVLFYVITYLIIKFQNKLAH